MPQSPSNTQSACAVLPQTQLPAGEDFVGQATSLWIFAWDAWVHYAARALAADSPMALYEAGAQWVSDSLDIGGRAAAARLRDGDLDTPLLSDA
jgi:hypothetical protein